MAIINLSKDRLEQVAIAVGSTLIRGAVIKSLVLEEGVSPDKSFYQSTLGTPVMIDLTLKGGIYKDEAGNSLSFDDIVFQTVLVSINQTKSIVKTAIQGRPGLVKEYIGLGDYSISISAIITGPNGSYPREAVTALKNLAVAPVRIGVVSWYLDMFDITHIVIDDFSLEQVEGGYSYQTISINASSDLYFSPVMQ